MCEPPTNRASFGRGPRGILEGRKPLLDFPDHGAVIDRAGRRNDHVGRPIVARQVAGDAFPIKRPHRRGCTKDGTADRLIWKCRGLQAVPDQIVRRVFGGADFLDDHVLLALQFVRIECRIGQDVGEHIQRQRHVGLEHARIVGGGFDRGRGIEIAADRLDILGDLTRGPPRGALERHVLEQMRNAMLVRLLVAAAGADPDAERSGLQMRHRVSHDRETTGQTRDFDAHATTPSRAARLVDRIWRSTAN